MKKKPSWGIPHLIIGIFLTLPLIRNYEENKNQGLFYIFVALGFVILIVGVVKMLIRLFFNYDNETNNITDTNKDKDIDYKTRKTEIKNRSNTANETAANDTLGFIFVILSYAVLAITILGTIVVLIVASPGSISGVPIGVGIMIAGVLFLIGKTC